MRKSIDGISPGVSHPPRRPVRIDQPRRPLRVPDRSRMSRPIQPPMFTLPPVAKSLDGILRVQRKLPVSRQVIEHALGTRPRVGFDTPQFLNAERKKRSGVKAMWPRRMLAFLQYPVAAGAAILAVYDTSIGQWLVLAYAIYAVARKLDSQLTFIAALMLLIAIPLFQIIGQPGVSENVAVYAYEMLVVGTIQAVVDLALSSRKKQTMVQ